MYLSPSWTLYSTPQNSLQKYLFWKFLLRTIYIWQRGSSVYRILYKPVDRHTYLNYDWTSASLKNPYHIHSFWGPEGYTESSKCSRHNITCTFIFSGGNTHLFSFTIWGIFKNKSKVGLFISPRTKIQRWNLIIVVCHNLQWEQS